MSQYRKESTFEKPILTMNAIAMLPAVVNTGTLYN
jgi:hypothetical protein